MSAPRMNSQFMACSHEDGMGFENHFAALPSEQRGTATPPLTRPLTTAVALLATTTAARCGSDTTAPTATAPPPLAVSVSPTSASIPVNATQQFTATLQNDQSNKGVTWALMQEGASCSAQCGTLSATSSASGTPITYTAPATVPSDPNVALTATPVADIT